MMLWGAHLGSLELRAEGGETCLRASFPYGRVAVMAEGIGGGRRLEEVIAPRAFSDRIDSGDDIHLLSGHDFNKPLASRSAGTLTLSETDEALSIEALISVDMGQVTWARDFLASNAAGLTRGLSPGFRVSPSGETIEDREDARCRGADRHGAKLREPLGRRFALSSQSIIYRASDPRGTAPARHLDSSTSGRAAGRGGQCKAWGRGEDRHATPAASLRCRRQGKGGFGTTPEQSPVGDSEALLARLRKPSPKGSRRKSSTSRGSVVSMDQART